MHPPHHASHQSARGASKFSHSGYLTNALVNSVISRKSQKLLSGLLVREDLNAFELPRHDPGAFTEAVHRIAGRIELAGERAHHIAVFVEFFATFLNKKSPMPSLLAVA